MKKILFKSALSLLFLLSTLFITTCSNGSDLLFGFLKQGNGEAYGIIFQPLPEITGKVIESSNHVDESQNSSQFETVLNILSQSTQVGGTSKQVCHVANRLAEYYKFVHEPDLYLCLLKGLEKLGKISERSNLVMGFKSDKNPDKWKKITFVDWKKKFHKTEIKYDSYESEPFPISRHRIQITYEKIRLRTVISMMQNIEVFTDLTMSADKKFANLRSILNTRGIYEGGKWQDKGTHLLWEGMLAGLTLYSRTDTQENFDLFKMVSYYNNPRIETRFSAGFSYKRNDSLDSVAMSAGTMGGTILEKKSGNQFQSSWKWEYPFQVPLEEIPSIVFEQSPYQMVQAPLENYELHGSEVLTLGVIEDVVDSKEPTIKNMVDACKQEFDVSAYDINRSDCINLSL